MSGVSIICFAACYSIALVLEWTRLVFRSGVRGAVMLGFAGVGLFAHSVFLYYRATHATGPPLSSEQDWYLVAAWGLVAVYLYLTYYHPTIPFGLFVLPLVLVLIGVAGLLAQAEPYAREPASRVWGTLHGVSIVLATVSVFTGFVAGLMYLWQAWRLKRRRLALRRLRLPSLEWLERVNSRAIVISTLMLGVGVLSGIVLNLINHADRVPVYDPVVLSTLLVFIWLAVVACVGAVYRPARAGRKVAGLTVVSFLILALALTVGLLLESEHGGGFETPSGAEDASITQGKDRYVVANRSDGHVEQPALAGSSTPCRLPCHGSLPLAAFPALGGSA